MAASNYFIYVPVVSPISRDSNVYTMQLLYEFLTTDTRPPIKAVVCQSYMTALSGEAAFFILHDMRGTPPPGQSNFYRLIWGYRLGSDRTIGGPTPTLLWVGI